MNRTPRSLALLGIAFVCSACAAAPPAKTADPCSAEVLDQTTDAGTLRHLASACVRSPGVAASARAKLNSLPPPKPMALALQPPVTMPESERVTFALDFFYAPFESYPTPAAFSKLEILISLMNSTYAVQSISLAARADAKEKADPEGANIARRRAEFVMRYLRATGLDEQVPIEIVELDPQHDKSPKGRAQDRAVEVEINAYRQRERPP